MRPDIVPGSKFPDYELSDHTGRRRKLSGTARTSSQNLFIYILEHPSRQEAEKNWAAFQAGPEWQKVKAESEKNGPLADHIDRYFMDPTSYSGMN